MDTNFDAKYYEDRARYYKVIVGLLLLTTVTFIQPHMFLTNVTFGVQLFIAAVKAWLIVMYYMHLKGETLIGWTVIFAMALVTFFFTVVITDVHHFQFKDVSHITKQSADGHEHFASHEE
jgi:caa(3)-type oxidase subunit IV